MSLLSYVSPFRLYKEYIIKPIQVFIVRQYSGYKKKTDAGLSSAKELLYRAGIVTVFLTAILWISIFLYVIFYYTYMPNVTHVRPVHLQFKSCEEQMGICSFPSAHVQLTKKSHMLMSAQPYRIKLTLDMPESQVNKDLGMFMVCAQMRAKRGVLVTASCRSAMLRHRSRLHTLLRTLVLSPLLLAGLEEEKQQLQVELFSDFEDDQNDRWKAIVNFSDGMASDWVENKDTAVLGSQTAQTKNRTLRFITAQPTSHCIYLNLPVTDAYVEVQSRFAQVYSCELHIQAHFTGLRYAMFHWPNVSAVIGISTNLFFVSLVFILSWYHLQEGLPDFVKYKLKGEIKDEHDDKQFSGKIKLEKEDSSSFFEGDTLLEEFRQIEESQKT